MTQETPAAATVSRAKKLSLIPLVFLIYFEVAGGPYGEEPAVQAAGPLLAIIGFTVFPFIWSVPEALITAELCTTFPGNGGFVIWADRAFGPFWGSLMGTWKFLCGVVNIASFPALGINYVQQAIPALESGWPRYTALMGFTLALSFLNYTGLAIVGYTAIILAVISLAPFILMSLIAIPKIRPHRWLSLGQKGVKKDWTLFFNTLFWNLNFWDSVSTVAGEVDKPQKTFPLALLIAVIFTCVSYLIPLVAVTGAVPLVQTQWETGFHAEAAEMIAGKWLKYWIQFGSVLSAIGLFEAQLSSCAYQFFGMVDIGVLPCFLGNRSKRFNTPWVGIVISTIIALAVSFMDFEDIIASGNLLYSLGMLLEFASFLWLRWKSPMLERPFRVPVKLPLLVIMCLIPSVFLILIIVIAKKFVYLVTGIMTVAGIGFFFLMNLCKTKKWMRFNVAQVGEDRPRPDPETGV
ncbi:hypothetical protein QN277_014946 [Acacia crassicarpa]|uniref:Polyamine transporter n=1 Tax=Acacia crassicarpa TaxID=499986 RepID=A0AAE1JX78_9FABA|nr:hypothetical protein QN277_014946 [Acacia crassicarpa]